MANKRVAILGGGITGLAAALRLHEAETPVDWRLLEAAARVGGVLETVEVAGYRLELSADNFLTREPWGTDLCRQVGVAEELIPTDAERRRALVVHRGRVTPVPEGFVLMSPQRAWPILASPILSMGGKTRLATEVLVPRRSEDLDESVAAFARRRLGREAFERLVQPLVAGIYTADPERLSMLATMPQFVEQERRHGSLTRAALAGRRARREESRESGARYGLFVAPRGGMQQMVDAVAGALPEDRVQLNARIARIERAGQACWRLVGVDQESLGEFDEVIVALPAPAAAAVLNQVDSDLAADLGQIEYAGCSVVCFGVHERQIARPVNGFGFVVPAVEGRRIIAASFASYKFPDRAPAGRVLVRVFIGGALQPELAGLEDERLVRIAREELGELVGLSGELDFARVARWPQRMPQYHVGHVDRVARIERRAAEIGVELAGAAYRGVGVPQCIRSGGQAATRVLERLAGPAQS